MAPDSDHSSSMSSGKFRDFIQSGSESEFVSAVRLASNRICSSLHVEEDHYEKIQDEIEKDTSYQNTRNTWEDLTPEERTGKWHVQLQRITEIAYSSRPYCRRCGECCSRMSPSLHPEDMELFEKGILRYEDVYTLRKGEPVLNNTKGDLENLPSELVKIKEAPGGRRCRSYDEDTKSCRIYEQRPLQCRTQECWNPQGLEELWKGEKLTRKHFLKDDAELLELIDVHEQRCPPVELDAAIKRYWETNEDSDLDPVVDMLSQDMIIRNFFIEKLQRDSGELDFLLGRPLSRIVESYRLRVEQDEDGMYRLAQER